MAGATLICSSGLGAEIAMEYIDGFIAASRRKKLEPVLQMLVADPEIVTGEMLEDVLRFKRLDGVDAALRKLRERLFRDGRQAGSMRDRLTAVKPPLQVIWGAQDRIIPASHAHGLPDAIKVTILEGAGHLAHMERAAEVNRLIGAAVIA